MAIGLAIHASSQGQLCDRSSIDSPGVHDNKSIRFRCKNHFFGAMHSCWLATGPEPTLLKSRVAEDYSDSLSDSSKDHGRNKVMVLSDAEIAKTVVEANDKAQLVFTARTHCEPHGHISWAEFCYVIDDYGDIFFKVFDEENILEDRGNRSPVTCLIGMGSPVYINSRVVNSCYIDNFDIGSWSDDEIEDINTEISDTLIKWGMPDTLRRVHPLYFAKCLAKAVHSNYEKQMEFPSNGLAIVGQLRPVCRDEEYYARKLFHHGDSDDYSSDYRDECEKEEEQIAGAYNLIDDGSFDLKSKYEGSRKSALYKLNIMSIDLFSVYGYQTVVNLQDFLDAEPDILAQSGPVILEHLNGLGMECSSALKTLCRNRRGLTVEAARLIGIDSLGMDVRVFAGLEARTLRFSFTSRALSESSAEKKIKRMIFPRHGRRSLRTPDGVTSKAPDARSSS